MYRNATIKTQVNMNRKWHHQDTSEYEKKMSQPRTKVWHQEKEKQNMNKPTKTTRVNAIRINRPPLSDRIRVYRIETKIIVSHDPCPVE